MPKHTLPRSVYTFSGLIPCTDLIDGPNPYEVFRPFIMKTEVVKGILTLYAIPRCHVPSASSCDNFTECKKEVRANETILLGD
jgi:hypothetical protein